MDTALPVTLACILGYHDWRREPVVVANRPATRSRCISCGSVDVRFNPPSEVNYTEPRVTGFDREAYTREYDRSHREQHRNRMRAHRARLKAQRERETVQEGSVA